MKRLVLSIAITTLFQSPVLSAGDSDLIDLDAKSTTVRVEARRSFLVGTWYRKQPTKQGGSSEETAKLMNDGSYRFTFRTVAADGSVEEFTELGRWGIVDDIHFTTTTGYEENGKITGADTTDPRRYAVYEVLELSKNRFRYRHKITGNVYTLRRVAKTGRPGHSSD